MLVAIINNAWDACCVDRMPEILSMRLTDNGDEIFRAGRSDNDEHDVGVCFLNWDMQMVDLKLSGSNSTCVGAFLLRWCQF